MRFEKICITGDYRYLLKTEKLPVYNQDKLLQVWDQITDEYDKLTKRKEFKRGYEDNIEMLQEENRLQGIQSALILMRLNQKRAIEDLAYWNIIVKDISLESIREVKSYLYGERTRLNIEYWEEENYKDLEKQGRISMMQAMIQSENALGRSIGDKTKISLSEWVYISAEVDKNIAAKQKLKKNHANTWD